TISLDRAAGMNEAVTHLLDQGHRHFGLLAVARAPQSRYDRMTGIRAALRARQMEFDRSTLSLDHLHERSNDFEYGRRLAGSFLQQSPRPTALLALNDEIAIGAVGGLQDAGLKVPRDLSVIGFNNQEVSLLISPTLTTVDQNIAETVAAAAEVLLAQLTGQVGAKPVPCEPNASTYNLDPGAIAAAVTPRTKAILPIHLYGQTADLVAINAFAERHGLFVLEDAAQSHGALCHGRASGALGHAAAHSFYPSKNLGAMADAGAITTDDAKLADRLRHLRNYGCKVRYQNDYAGLNSRLGELQAAFLRVKLPHLPAWNERRRSLAARYLTQLQGVGDLVLPQVPSWAEPVWHLFVVRSAKR
ncbi:MAG: hypothetical protein EBR23_15170, partial [Planctomycetia bacterium]|nr:hypothetical protein [Planctomycetia bacterium]